MDVILSRVGVSNTELQQHCVGAVVDELKQSKERVQNVVQSLKQVLKVVQASQELHKSMALNSLHEIQTSFRDLGESCNQIGPLLRLLHYNMSGAVPSATSESSAIAAASGTQSKTDPPSTSAGKPSDGEDDSDDSDEAVVVVEVEHSKKQRKRKAATLDLSGSPTRVKRNMSEDVQSLRDSLPQKLLSLKANQDADYLWAHDELTHFVTKVFAVETLDDGWKPRVDPMLGQLLNEMKNRLRSIATDNKDQKQRLKEVDEWLEAMAVVSFVPSLNLSLIPPKKHPLVKFFADSKPPTAGLKTSIWRVTAILQKLAKESTSRDKKRKLYYQPLLDATIRYLATAAHQPKKHVDNDVQGKSLRMVVELSGGHVLTLKESLQLEELLYLVRILMRLNPVFCKKAKSLIPNLLELFPPVSRPDFSYTIEVEEKKKKKAKKK